MAIIQKIQRQTGCLLILVGGAMIAFVLTDLLSSGTSIFGNRGENNVGEIAGKPVSYQEFNERFEGLMASLQASNPEIEINEGIREAYREQAWNQVIQDRIVSAEFEKLGIMVGADEMEDNTFGNNPHPQVVSAFTDPQSGQFNKARLIQFLQQDIENNEQAKNQWLSFEKALRDQMVSEKYTKLIQSSIYMPKALAVARYEEQNKSVSGNIVGIDYSAIADTAVSFTDKDLERYLSKHASEFKQENARDLEYVVYSVVPTRADTLAVRDWAAQQADKFRQAENDSSFLELMNSETPFYNNYQSLGSFPEEIESALFAADSGQVLGPVYSNGGYGLYKLVGTGTDSLFTFRMSHILVPVEGPNKEDTIAAQKKAADLLAEIRSGSKQFESEAMRNFDGTGARQGDLGYIREDNLGWPKKLINAGLSNNPGQYFIVTTERGVHIAKVTAAKTKRTLKVAVLNQSITASNETYRVAYREAGEFIGLANKDGFEAAAEAKKLSKRIAANITEKNPQIQGLSDPKPLVRWAFDAETEVGSVSDVIETEDRFIVAYCKAIKKEGKPSIEDVRSELEVKVRNEKKAELIVKQIEDAQKSAKTLEDLAAKLSTAVRNIPAQTFDNDNVSYIGVDYKVLGTLFGLEDGKRSEIVIGEQGVYIVERKGTNAIELPKDIAQYQSSLVSELSNQSEASAINALRTKAKIKDYRYKFY